MPKGSPTLSLCIPAFNAEAFLGRLLESARGQTVAFDEIWVYDDASTDSTAELARHNGAYVVTGTTNRGCSAGKNVLAHRTSSEWLHFHDADDALEPDFVEKAQRWMSLPKGPDVVFFNYRSLDHDTNVEIGRREFDGAALRADPLGYCLAEQINPFCGLYRRSSFLAAGGWDEDPKVLQSEDQAGHLRLALAGLQFDADPSFTVVNYIRQLSMTTSNFPGALRSTFEVMLKATAATSPSYWGVIARRLWVVAGLSGAHGDWPNADRSAQLALKLAPNGPIPGSAWFGWLAIRSPRVALRLRERLIRLLRPGARNASNFRRQKSLPALSRPGS